MSYDKGWKSWYRERLNSPEPVLRSVLHDGSRVFIATGCSEPQRLVRALVDMVPEYMDLELVQNLSSGALPDDWSLLHGHCRLKTFFAGPKARRAIDLCFADYIPIHFASLPDLFREDRSWDIDVALVQVSPPDEHGFCSFGIGVDANKAAAECAKAVVAQVNPLMPRTLGDSFIHVTQMDRIVEYREPLLQVTYGGRSAVADRIGRYVSSLVEDGATIQIGIGRIAGSVLRSLDDKHDLGIHSEVLTDDHLALIRKGVVTGRKKTLHPGKIIVSACLGTRELYDFVHNNPEVEFYPIDYVYDRRIISRNSRMTAINSALEIDLGGQVCADSIGHQVFSGIGGYVDFMHGASHSPGGNTIIVLPSTTSDGRRSRIVSHLTSGAGVVSSRSTVRYVVTEFGIAFLHGKTIRERSLALINIAHPRFRERLLDEAKRLHYVYPDQMLPPIYEPLYPGQWETRMVFPGNIPTFFRPVRPTDERALQEFFYSLPDQDVYYRFLSAMKVFPHRDTQSMCNIDYEHEMGIVAVTGEIGNETIIGLGRYILDQKTNLAEVDFTVRMEWQRHGIGSFLLKTLCDIARSKGISGFIAYVLATNRRMLSVFYKAGYAVHSTLRDTVYEIVFRFDEPAGIGILDNQ